MSRLSIPTSRSMARVAIYIVAILLVAGITWWAASIAFQQRSTVNQSRDEEQTWVKAVETEIGRTLNYNVVVKTPLAPLAANQLTGVLTGVNTARIPHGGWVYKVNDRGCYAFEGSQPFYRKMKSGMNGWDIKQLQQGLKKAGFLKVQPSGEFDESTTTAVRSWQKTNGEKATGEIPLGQVVAMKTLPAQVDFSTDTSLGQQLSGGEELVQAPVGAANFVLVLDEEQAKFVPEGAKVTIRYKKFTWHAVLGQRQKNDHGGYQWVLKRPEGGKVCGKDCHALPGSKNFSLLSAIEVVPTSRGIGIPTAAIRSEADGTTTVETRQGRKNVQVKASGEGITIITGLDSGTEVLLPGPQ